MKKLLLLFAFFLSYTSPIFAQTEDCENICTIDKTVYEDAFLGVQFGSPCDREIDKGVIVLKVVANTAASDSDFKAYDVVLSINGTNVDRRGDAIKKINAFKPFDEVRFSIYRDGKTIIKKVILGAKTTKIVQEKICCEDVSSSLHDTNIKVFPSPATSNLNITFESLIQGDYKFEIYMANGVLVKEYNKKIDKGNLQEVIPVDKLQDGVYILKIRNKQTTFSKLFVVNRS
ncbi:PDZ domain-containing protein [uncultured Lacinutrix sp.]|uniref:PDZ domain-containing protein n=1 Tax=uncultured Lacinutrix sp. TaxID=574032 RepID=UPI00261EC36B|nr:PDZ domain-containing protein [uncultured Lacinutrix sp.]